MIPTLPLDDLRALIDHQATRHVLRAKDYGPPSGGRDAAVTLYRLIPIQQHQQPWIVHVDEWDGETLEAFDNHREAEAAYEHAIDLLDRVYNDDYYGG
jgi:hypothetical protein